MNVLFMGFCCILCAFGAIAYAHAHVPNQKTIVILLGPPGSGKGTQATRITKELGIPHISTGDLFRANIKGDTALGKKAKGFMDAGKLVPDEVVLEMLFDRVSQPDTAHGYLLDGFPRTVAQAEALDKALGDTKVVVINLQVPDEVIVKRIAGRLQEGQTSQRADDKPEVVQERLRVYHEQTEPVERHYDKKGMLNNIDGQKTPDEVYAEVMNIFKKN